MQATVTRDLPHQNVMQSNTARIVEQMNYDDVVPYLLTYFILSYPEHNNLSKAKDQEKYCMSLKKSTRVQMTLLKIFSRHYKMQKIIATIN